MQKQLFQGKTFFLDFTDDHQGSAQFVDQCLDALWTVGTAGDAIAIDDHLLLAAPVHQSWWQLPEKLDFVAGVTSGEIGYQALLNDAPFGQNGHAVGDLFHFRQ